MQYINRNKFFKIILQNLSFYLIYLLFSQTSFAQIIQLQAVTEKFKHNFIYPSELIPDERSITEKLWYGMTGLMNEGKFIIEKNSLIQNYNLSSWKNYTTPKPLKFNKLIVFFHGLNSSPGAWEKHIRWLEEKTESVDIYAPSLTLKGNTELAKVLAPLEKTLKTYSRKSSNLPICFIATSNGARIALHLEHKLRSIPSKILLSSAAGVFFGTKRIIFRYLFTHPAVYHELSYANIISKQLILSARQPLAANIIRKFDFYGTKDDSQISPFNSAFPLINQKETFYLVKNSNHNHIVGEVFSHQLERCLTWLKTEG